MKRQISETEGGDGIEIRRRWRVAPREKLQWCIEASTTPHLGEVEVTDEVRPRCHGEDHDGAHADIVGIACCGYEHERREAGNPIGESGEHPWHLTTRFEIIIRPTV